VRDKSARMLGIALIAVYVAIPIALALGTYRGWLFDSGTPSTAYTEMAAAGFCALLAATMAAEYLGAFKRAAAGREGLLAIAWWIGAFVWAIVWVRLFRDTRLGAAILIGPVSALLLGGMFYLARFGAFCTRALIASTMTATPTPMGQPISNDPSPREATAWAGHPVQSDRVDIAAHRGKIALRLIGGCAASLILALVLRGTRYDGLNAGIFFAGALFLGVLALRSLLSRGPLLSLASDGVSIRRDVSTVRHLSWAQIASFEMKSSMGNAFFVIHVKDPNALIAQYAPLSRWFMGQSQAMFGSPVRVPVGWLKCDPNWLWQKANEMLAASRATKRGS
jgi:hypothetical protein